MTVHSNQLVAENAVPSSYTLSYTVPSNVRTIVKNITAWNSAAAANELDVEVRNGATVLATFVFRMVATGSVGDSIAIETWIVMLPGQTLYLARNGANVSVIISGTELDI